MSITTVILFVIAHASFSVACFVLIISDKEWFQTTPRQHRITVYWFAVIPLVNILLLIIMLPGFFMDKALFGSSKKD